MCTGPLHWCARGDREITSSFYQVFSKFPKCFCKLFVSVFFSSYGFLKGICDDRFVRYLWVIQPPVWLNILLFLLSQISCTTIRRYNYCNIVEPLLMDFSCSRTPHFSEHLLNPLGPKSGQHQFSLSCPKGVCLQGVRLLPSIRAVL